MGPTMLNVVVMCTVAALVDSSRATISQQQDDEEQRDVSKVQQSLC